ncbi:hypothetical protein Acr_04g0001370 [Actinidia rufa]|uniref:Transposase (putative) gypsy type domain-containing protein n=1 Tax=Actinidia rufa TaxID=165716 RepID=A0A7J0EHL8_9ERIC|nr:hypothetical protein Acr_04g0001370 [Actinidia rufa]
MSNRINLGDGELGQSLPSWISNHLGGKSYITDDANQSPSPLRVSPTDHSSAYSDMTPRILPKRPMSCLKATWISLGKILLSFWDPTQDPRRSGPLEESYLCDESFILSQEDLGLEEFGILGITIVVEFFWLGFEVKGVFLVRFPIHPIIRRILNHYKIYPAQLSPNAWRSIICSLMIWRYYKRHMSYDEFRCLYSLNPLPDSGWYYFKARPDKTLLRGSPSNVKGWKKRFFFVSRDEWEFFPSMPPGKNYNTLPVLTEDEVKRTTEVLGKIEPGGYFEVSKVFGSKTFKKHFALGRVEVSSNGGDKTTSSDEGNSRLFQGDLRGGSSSCSKSVECLGVIRGDIRMIARKAFPDTPDLILLRWLGGKVGEKKAVSKDAGSMATFQPPMKGIVNREKRPREDSHATKEGEADNSKGKAAMTPPPPKKTKSNKGAINAAMRTSAPGTSSSPPGDNLDLGVSMMSSATVTRKILNGVILLAYKEKARQFTPDDLATKTFHALGQAVVFVSSLALQSQEHQNDVDLQIARADSAELELAAKASVELDKFEAVARLEPEVAELSSKLVQVEKLAIEEFKSLDDFKAAVTNSATMYFDEGFEFCKRQLLHQHPNLGIDVASMELDAGFAEEEEATNEGEKKEGTEGEANPDP